MVQRGRQAVRKRSLPIGVRHSRHQITLSPAHVKRLRQRVAAARAAGSGGSFSGEIARCVDEADGNLRTVRHALRTPLHGLSLHVALLRQKLAAGGRIDAEDLTPLDAAVKKIAGRLEPPAA